MLGPSMVLNFFSAGFLLVSSVECVSPRTSAARQSIDDGMGGVVGHRGLLNYRNRAGQLEGVSLITNNSTLLSHDRGDAHAVSDGTPLGEMVQVGDEQPPGFAQADLAGFEARTLHGPIGALRHPMWQPEIWRANKFEVLVCCVALFFAGILCSAGGIGGGGIYVTVLMVFGQLEVVDAVPLSKAVVFFGSISSLILNMRKSVSSSSTKTLIDYNICRLVVPAALLGTYAGVFLNWLLPGWIIVLLLTVILCIMSATVARTAMQQHAEEQKRALLAASDKAASQSFEEHLHEALEAPIAEARSSAKGSFTKDSPTATAYGAASHGALPQDSNQQLDAGKPPNGPKLRNQLTLRDVVLAVGTEFCVVSCSVIHFHAQSCLTSLGTSGAEAACNHPALSYFGHGTMQTWMEHQTSSSLLLHFTMLFPACACALVLTFYTSALVKHEGWCLSEALCYHSMAIITGALAGLVGIGGGLIFAPFFLGMAVEPSVAVATSSTCVIFTSSSTTLQYLLTDRIIMSLTVVYGIINLVASYSGTSLVHMVQDRFLTNRSYISLIVGAGVLISAALSINKLLHSVV